MVWNDAMRAKALATRQAKKHPNVTGPHVKTNWSIDVDVDWQGLPMDEAQAAYAQLKKEFERSGRVLNERSMPAPGSYKCFMCEITHLGDARGKDDAQVDPRTDLAIRARICGEECWIAWQDFCIKTRAMRNSPITKEEYIRQYEELLAAMRKLRHLKMMKTA